MKKFDINTVAKTKKIKLTWNQKLQAEGIATWQQSFNALTILMSK